MGKNSFSDFSPWVWVLYPVVVAGFILFSLNYLLTGGFTSIGSLVSQKDKAEEEATTKVALQTKLEMLKTADKKEIEADMEIMNQAVPLSRSVWFLINELEYAGSQTGSVLISYQGYVGDITQANEKDKTDPSEAPVQELVLTAKYDVTDIQRIGKLLGILENLKPLANVRKVTLDSYTGIEVIVEGAWATPIKPSYEATTPLPDYKTQVKQIKERLEGFKDINVAATSSSSSFGGSEESQIDGL